jgi:hypothetical protein
MDPLDSVGVDIPLREPPQRFLEGGAAFQPGEGGPNAVRSSTVPRAELNVTPSFWASSIS